MPNKKLSRKESSFFLKPWLNTKGIRTSIRTRNILLGKSKRQKSEQSYRKYKTYDRILEKVKKRSFNNHIAKEVSDNFENKQKLWQTIHKITNKKRGKKSEIKHLLIWANFFSDYEFIDENVLENKIFQQNFAKFPPISKIRIFQNEYFKHNKGFAGISRF